MTEFVNVTNKSSGRVVYSIKEDGIRREFYPRQTKKNIPVSEIQKLAQQPGGLNLLYNYLLVQSPEVVKELVDDVAPEYWITEEELPKWMETCSLDEFKDALDFAPEGTKDLIKKYAVSLPLNDYAKRHAIQEQLGFNIDEMVKNSGEEVDGVKIAKPAARRVVANVTAPEEGQRRVTINT